MQKTIKRIKRINIMNISSKKQSLKKFIENLNNNDKESIKKEI